ncbi:MAG: tyrosine-type recombinase/integrase, partial [Candidatus Bathyarchaeia archaeon]
FLFSTGLRVSTLIALTYGDVKDDLEKGYSIIRVPVYPEMKKRVPGACKNNVPYYTFACEEAVKVLRLYLRERIEKYGSIEPYEPLFCSEYNQISFQERRLKFMTPREVQRIIKDAARKAGIANWMYVTPHSLRKTYESMLRSELIDGGRLDVKTQEFLMGHILPGSQDAYYDKTKCEQLRLEYARINFGRKVVENKFSLLETALTKAFEGTGIDWKEVLIEYVKTRMNLCF